MVQPLTQEVQGGHPEREGHPAKGGRHQVHLHPAPRPAQAEGMHPTDSQGRTVATHLWAEAAAPAGPPAPSAPAVADASTQTELPRSEAAVQTSGCWKCPGLSPGAGTGSRIACQRCAQKEDFLQQGAELQEAGRRLHSSKEADEELQGWILHSLQGTHSPQPNNPKIPHCTHRREGGQYHQRIEGGNDKGRRVFPQSLRCPYRKRHLSIDGKGKTCGRGLELG